MDGFLFTKKKEEYYFHFFFIFQEIKMQPTLKQQQYIETIHNRGKNIRINKKFGGLDLQKFDMELPDGFQNQFAGATQFKKQSSSPTKVFKTKLDGKDYYVKVFHIPEDFVYDKDDMEASLLYEKEVYRYLRSKAVGNKDIKNHFIQMKLSAKDPEKKLGFLFTQDTKGVPLYLIQRSKHSLEKNFNDFRHTISARFVANIFTQLLYVIYLSQSIHLVHNDLHFGNVLIVKDNVHNKKYEMFGRVFDLVDHPYTIMVYDFDMASIIDPMHLQNPFRQRLCKEYGRCKDYLQTDLYVWLLHLLDSPSTWSFASLGEKERYTQLLSVFKTALKTDVKQTEWYKKLYRLLFPIKTAQSEAIEMIEKKNQKYRALHRYPQPIFHVSCKDYNPATLLCKHPMKPINQDKITGAWHKAFISL